MTTQKMIEVVADASTNEVLVIEFSAEKIEQLEQDLEDSKTHAKALEKAKTSAIAKLAALGLTEEEIASL